ncbi:phosphotransferase [Promicromonospora sp. NPDC019610]|uniref:phosphotransferase n=1 Tax=Promicromonospora sp. NPDC019610 TaxID=3364405 RepID=UPI00378B9025
MTNEHRERLAAYLHDAADRLGVAIESERVHGLYDRTIAARVSGPAWLRLTTEQPRWTDKDTMWDGIAAATGEPFDDIPMPRHVRSVIWTDDGLVVRADLLTYVGQHAIGKGLVLDREVDLGDHWWQALQTGLEPLQRITTTKRVAADPREGSFRNHFLASFGVKIEPERVEMAMSHGDLHFGNLTAPELVILDWENWGWAPAGYDAAHLLCSAILQPAIVARVRAEFAGLLDTYSGAVAVLTAASKYLHHVESGEFPSIAIPIRCYAETVIRDHLAV